MKVRVMFIVVEDAMQGAPIAGVFGEFEKVVKHNDKLMIMGEDGEIHGQYDIDKVKVLQDLGYMTKEEAAQAAQGLMTGATSPLYGAEDVLGGAKEQQTNNTYRDRQWTEDEIPDSAEKDQSLEDHLLDMGGSVLRNILGAIEEDQKKRRGRN